jgi:hypothetical protein
LFRKKKILFNYQLKMEENSGQKNSALLEGKWKNIDNIVQEI